MELSDKRVLLAIYNHPEAYPPTLNVIGQLSPKIEQLTVLCNNFLNSQWDYPQNCLLLPIGSLIGFRQFGRLPLYKRIARWLTYSYNLWKLLKKNDILIVHDSFPLASYYLVQFFLRRKPKLIWYHNHDVMEKKLYKKFTLNWLVSKLEPLAFSHINIFSLPASERLKYFPVNKFNGKVFLIRNFPSKKHFSLPAKKKQAGINLIFQGTLSDGHGFEEIISVLPHSIDGREIKLHLVGPVKQDYKAELLKLVKNQNALEFVHFLGRRPYRLIPEISSGCHIGVAIFTKTDIMNSTLGTASNKIYEYAAVGLPVLYFDNQHFRSHLNKYSWAIPNDLSKDSLLKSIKYIMDNYEKLSNAAKNTFNQETNFEAEFTKVLDYLKSYE